MREPDPKLIAARLLIEQQRELIAQLSEQVERARSLADATTQVLRASYSQK